MNTTIGITNKGWQRAGAFALALTLAGVLPLTGCASVAPQSADTDLGWPRSVDIDGAQLLIYQPQVDSWRGNRLTARSAITIAPAATPTPVHGVVDISARTDVDKESRLVTLNDLRVDGASFSSAGGTEGDLLRAVRDSVGRWPRTIELDRLQASLAIAQAEEGAAAPTSLKNTPPRIFLSAVPAVLIQIDGEPVYRPVPGASLTRIINTPALILHD